MLGARWFGILSLGFDAEVVARWFPLGASRKNIVIDPARAFGRPIVAVGGMATEIITQAVRVEGSPERVAALYEVPLPAVRDALDFSASSPLEVAFGP